MSLKLKNDHGINSGSNDGFDATITKSRFGNVEQRSEPSLIMTLEHDDGKKSDVAFNTGIGWEILNGGRSVKNPMRRGFMVYTVIACLMTRVLHDLDVHLYDRGSSTDADIWDGLKFHWKIEEIILGEGRKEGILGKITQLMPTKFLGGHENRDRKKELDQLIEACKSKRQDKHS
jgi:hypothetical protein